MRTAGSNRLRGELAGNELRTRKEYVSDRDAGFKQPLERCKLLTRWAFEYFDQTGCRGCPSFGTGRGFAGVRGTRDALEGLIWRHFWFWSLISIFKCHVCAK